MRAADLILALGLTTTLAGLEASEASAESKAAPAAAAKDYSYVDCRITAWWKGADNKYVTKLALSCGSDDGVYKGSTGLIYLGDSAKKFVEVGGKRARFRVHEVHGGHAYATVYQTPLQESEVVDNRRVILRARKHGEKPDDPKDYTYAECRITAYEVNPNRTRVEKVDLNCGRDRRVYAGSTGLVFLGDEKKKFIEHLGKRTRFVVEEVDARSAKATVFQGHPTPESIDANQRVLLRVHKGK